MTTTKIDQKSGTSYKRCSQCILPENYPGIRFNEEGFCHYCTGHKDLNYRGGEALKAVALAHLAGRPGQSRDFDCVVGLSGGRDSSYMLNYLVKELELNVLVYSFDHGAIPEYTAENIQNITNILGTKLILEKNNLLKKCAGHGITSWIKRPSLPMVEVLCTGCRLGLRKGLYNCAKNNNIPIIFEGGTPFEYADYRINLMRLGFGSGRCAEIMGYLSHVIKNPKWIMNPTYLYAQFMEYIYWYYYGEMTQKLGVLRLSPFYFIKWREKEVISTIEEELNWKRNPHSGSTWRGDCSLAILKLYIYKAVLGFNDKDLGLSFLIRDQQLTRKEALERLEQEQALPETAIAEILDDFGIRFDAFKPALDQLRNQFKPDYH